MYNSKAAFIMYGREGGGAGEIEGGWGKIFSIKRGDGKFLDQKGGGIKKLFAFNLKHNSFIS